MGLAPWRSPLARALHLNRSLVYARYVQLATVDRDRRPANRTVVFRGFLDDDNQLQFITDQRSAKIEHIDHSPWGEVCWYFPKTREQFRLLGHLTLVAADYPDATLVAARQQLWQALSDAARLQFAWPNPGVERSPEAAFSPPAPDPLTPLANFCLLLLAPMQVDHLELRGNPQNRQRYCYNDAQQWAIAEVNP
ncbi:MAG TPA: Npun_F5749 family FMN-dependent PPOX-type flavoprotein [Chroococcidiopsis sp.]